MNGRFRTRRTVRYVEWTIEDGRDGAGARLWYAVSGWAALLLSAILAIAFGASLIAVLLGPAAWPAAIVFGFLALPGLVVLNAAVLFARLRRASPERYLVETRGRGFVRHLGWCGRSLLTQLHDSVKRLRGGDAQIAPLRVHVHATLRLHRYAFGLLIATVVAGLALAAIERLTR